MSIRRNHQSAAKSKARLSRIRERAIQLRNRVKESTVAFFARRDAKLAWWQRAFRTPMVGIQWLASKVSALWVAFMGLLGLQTKRTAKLAKRHGEVAVGKPQIRQLIHEGLEQRQLMAANIFGANDNVGPVTGAFADGATINDNTPTFDISHTFGDFRVANTGNANVLQWAIHDSLGGYQGQSSSNAGIVATPNSITLGTLADGHYQLRASQDVTGFVAAGPLSVPVAFGAINPTNGISGSEPIDSTFNFTVDTTAPAVSVNTGLTLTVTTSKVITSAQLSSVDTLSSSANVTYNVTSGPSRGYLAFASSPGTPITSFTQAQVNANSVIYVHTQTTTAPDSFTFTVDDLVDNTSAPQVFNINFTQAQIEFDLGNSSASESGVGAVPTLLVLGDLTGTAAVTRTVQFTLPSGTASNPGDFTLLGSFEIPAGNYTSVTAFNLATEGVFTVVNDTLVEGNETLTFALGPGTGVALAPSDVDLDSAVRTAVNHTITDDEFATISISGATITEAGGVQVGGIATLSITPGGTLAVPVSALVTDASGTATSGADYTAVSSGVTFGVGAANGATVAINVTPTNDLLVEAAETATLNLGSASGPVTLSAAPATFTITDNDNASVSIAGTTNGIEDVVPTNGKFTVSLNAVNNTGSDVLVTYSVAGTATSGADFAALSGVATIANGQSTATIDVLVNDDFNLENTENVTLTIGSVTSTGSVTVGSPSSASISIADVESVNAFLLTVSNEQEASNVGDNWVIALDKVNNTGSPLIVNYVIVAPTNATAAVDYSSLSGDVTINDGSNFVLIDLLPINDTLTEGNETVTLQLNSTTLLHPSITLDPFSFGPQTVTIVDDDSANVSISKTTDGAESPNVDAVFNVSISQVNANPVTVTYSVGGSATPGASDDFIAPSGTVVIPAGSTDVAVTVDVLDDALFESDEEIVLTITGISGQAGTVGFGGSATATIDDNETSTITVTATDPVALETGDTGVYKVDLGTVNNTGSAITVTYSMSGDAANPADYSLSGPVGIAVIPVGQQSAFVTLTSALDTIVEANEKAVMTLTGHSFVPGASLTVSSTPATVTIQDNDSATVSVNLTPGAASNYSEANPLIISPSQLNSFEVTLSSPSSTPTVVAYSVTGTATSGADFVPFTLSVTIPANATVASVPVSLFDDLVVEGPETIILTLTSITSGDAQISVGSPVSATRTILDNDTPTLTFVASDSVAAEPLNNGQFKITLSNPIASPVTVNYTIGGTATNGGDYVSIPGSIVINAMTTEVTVDVLVNDDSAVEGLETVTMAITSVTGSPVAITPPANVETVNIADDEIGVSISATVPNGSENGPTDAEFTVSLSQASATNVTVTYSIGGTASNGSDYTAIATSVVVPAGQLSAVVNIDVSDDLIIESTESVQLTLTGVSGASTAVLNGTTVASASIADNDLTNATVTIYANDSAGKEDPVPDNGQFTVDLGFVNGTGSPIVVTFTLSGDATLGSDYNASSTATVVIPNGSQTGLINIQVIDDNIVEPTEFVVAAITGVSSTSGTLAFSSTPATIVVDDNDSALVSVSATTQGAEGTPTTPVNPVFTVSLSKPSSSLTTVYYGLNGSATAPNDFSAPAGSIIVPAMTTLFTIPLSLVNDTVLEATEDVTITLTSVIGDPEISIDGSASVASLTISDDDGATLSIAATTSAASEPGTDGKFTISLNAASASPTTVTYSVGGTATNGSDYTMATGSIVIPANSLSVTLDVDVLDDALLEGPETVSVSLTGFTGDAGITLGTSSDVVTIADDENATATITAVTQASEPSTNGKFVINLGAVNNSPSPITVTYSIADSANPNVDYTQLAAGAVGTAVIPIGASTVDVDIVVLDDTEVEGDETIELQLTGASNPNVTLSPISAEVTISDNDSATVKITKVADGAEAGPVQGQFRVTLSALSSTNTVVTYTLGGSATNLDYNTVPLTGLVTIAAGQSTADINIAVFNDSLLESDETVVATLTGVSGDPQISTSTIAGDTVATVTIVDNESTTVTVTGTDSQSESVVNRVFNVSLGQLNETGVPILVTYTISGSATAGDDYATITGVAAIPNNSSSVNVTIAVVDDSLVEGTEDIVLTLTSASDPSVSVGSPSSATKTIVDNDNAAITIAATTQASEPATNGMFTVTMSNPSSTATTVTYTIAGNASAGSDYASLSGTVVIPALATTATIDVVVSDDLTLEADETVEVTLTSVTGDPEATLGSPIAAIVTITDNETAAVTVNASVANGAEGGANGQFVVQLSQASYSNTVITYALGGSAANGGDYTTPLPVGSVTILAGDTTATIDIAISDDLLLESQEQAVVTLLAISSGDSGISLGSPTISTVTIDDNDTTTVTIIANDSSAAEQLTDNGQFTVDLGKVNNTNAPIVVNFTLTGTAAGSDYSASAIGAVTIPIGSQTAQFNITPVDDALLESAETVVATLTGTSNAAATVSAAPATVTIADNDTATVSIGPANVTTTEGSANPVVTLTMSKVNDTGSPIFVTYSVGDILATSGSDYTAPSGVATIPVGGSTADVTITIADDGVVEGDEDFTLTLGSTSNGAVTASGVSSVTIVDNDSASISIAATTPTASEPATNGKFTVTMSAPSSSATVVTYTVTGDATSGSDYTALTGTVTIPANQTTATIDVLVSNDLVLEDDETVVVTLTTLTGDPQVTIGGSNSATVTILDTDSATISIAPANTTVSEGVGTVVLTVNLSQPSDTPTSLGYTLSGTATNGVDYTVSVGSVSFPALTTSALITVTIADDSLLESTENLTLTLTNPITGDADISLGSAISSSITITDNETATVTVSNDGNAAEPGTNGKFKVDLGKVNNTGLPITVTYNVTTSAAPNNASAGSDYQTLSGTVVIAPGAQSTSIDVLVLNDGTVEENENVIVTLNPSTSNASVSGSATPATVTITSEDTALISVAKTADASEPSTDGAFTVTMSAPSSTDTTVTYTFGGDATSGSDYTPLVGTVVINAGQTVATVTVDVSDDLVLEDDETVSITLTTLTGDSQISLGSPLTDTVTITDTDDATLSASTSTVSIVEPAVGPSTFVFTITMSKVSDTPTTISYSVSGGSASSGPDFTVASGPVTIPAFGSTADVTVTVNSDLLLESDETVVLTITNVDSGDVDITIGGSASATTTIVDSDTATVSIADLQNADESNVAVPGKFTVTMSKVNNTAAPITVTYSVSGGDAVPADYVAPVGTVVIPVGSSDATIDVFAVNDTIVENTETIQLSLQSATSNAAVTGSGSDSISIIDEDTATVSVVKTTDASEPASNGKFTVSMTNPSSTATTVTYTLGGSAGLGSDYTMTTGSVVLAPMVTQVTIDVTVSDDLLLESAETVVLTLTNVSGDPQISLSGSTAATVTISDNETATIGLAADFPNASETGPTNGQFTVNLGTVNNTGSTITINYNILSPADTATNGTDYTSISGVAYIIPGAQTADINIVPVNDTVVEANEKVVLQIASASGAPAVTFSSVPATVTIEDNDTATVSIGVSPSSAPESSSPGPFVVTLSQPSSTATTVTYSIGGTATNGADYGTLSGTVVIPAMQLTQTIAVSVSDDGVLEPDETIQLTLGAISGDPDISVGAPSSAVATIIDNETAAVSVAASVASASEAGPVHGQFVVSLSQASYSNTTISYTLGGSATSGSDYTALAGTVVIPAGSTTATIDVTVSDDALLESSESVTLTLSTITGGDSGITLGSPLAATISIADNDTATVSIAANDASASEPTPTNNGQFTVTMSKVNNTSSPITVTYTLGGSADNGVDYAPLSGSVAIPVGSSVATVNVNVLGDTIVEANETVVASLTGVSNAAVATVAGSSTVTIADNDSAAVTVAASNGSELGPVDGKFTISLSNPSSSPTTVTYSIGGSASSPSDYSVPAGTTTVIPAFASSVEITVDVSDDTLLEGPETVILSILGLTGDTDVTLGSPSSATVSIVDNESASVNIAVTDANAAEESDDGAFTVSLTTVSGADTTVTYSVGGSATNGTDYTALSGTVVIPAGTLTADIPVDVIGDLLLEGDQDVQVTITGVSTTGPAVNVGLTNAATLTIVDDESATATVTVDTQAAEAGPVHGVFKVDLGAVNNSGSGITVTYSVGGSASSPADYAALTGTVVIPNSQQSAFVTITVTDDLIVEADETVELTLTGDSNAAVTVSSTPATLTIADNDSATITLSIPDPTAQEPSNDGQFLVTMTKVSSTNTFVAYSLSGDAASGVDYTSLSGTVMIPAGMTTAVIDIDVIDDNVLDDDKLAVVQLTSVSSGDPQITVGSPNIGTVVILDEDTAVVSIAATDASANESGDAGSFTVTLGKPSATATTIAYGVTGTALAGADYAALSGTVVIPSGQTTAVINVTPSQDVLFEGPENVVVALTSVVSGDVDISVNTAPSTVVIADDDIPTLTLTASDSTASETGPDSGQFKVDLGVVNNTGLPINVTLSAPSGSATAGSDYATLTTVVSIPNGQSTATINVNPVDDLLLEGSETVKLSIVSANTTLVNVDTTERTVTIADNDTAVATISANLTTISESGSAVYTVALDKANDTASPIVITLATGGTASGADRNAMPASVSIPVGSSSATFTLTPVDDAIVEPTETVIMSLTGSSVGSVSASGSATVSITDNDTGLLYILPKQNATEGNPIPGAFTVWMTAPSSTATIVVYSVGGTATPTSDFTNPSGVVSLTAGVTSFDITIPVVDDLVVEFAETVVIQLTSITSGSPSISIDGSQDTASINIIDNDNAAPIITSSNAVNLAENQLAVMNVTAIDPDSLPSALSFSIVGGADASFFSINPTTGALSFNPAAFTSTGGAPDFESPLDAGANNTYIVMVQVFDGISTDTETITVSILDAVSEVGPKVTAIRVNGTGWVSNFRDVVDGQVAGSGLGRGYVVPSGANQTQTIPWTNVNQILVTFNSDVRGPGGAALTASSFSVVGVNVANYPITGFSYNSSTFTATLSFASSFGSDKILVFADATMVRGLNGGKLDGEWTTGVSSYPSGNNFEGSGNDFAFRINMLPGDVNNTTGVNSTDTGAVRNLQGQFISSSLYSVRHDVNGTGGINSTDTGAVRSLQGTFLPIANPTQPAGSGGEGSQAFQPSVPQNTLFGSLDELLSDGEVDLSFVGPKQELSNNLTDVSLESYLKQRGLLF